MILNFRAADFISNCIFYILNKTSQLREQLFSVTETKNNEKLSAEAKTFI